MLRKLKIYGAIALVCLLTVGYAYYTVDSNAREAERNEITIELNDRVIEKRTRIDEAIRIAPRIDSDDATDSLQYLRNR